MGRRKTKEDIVSRLREMLQSARFPSQSRLPAERDLAQELGVSRNSLRKALSELEADGVIWRHVGQGTFVGPEPGSYPADASSSPVTYNTNPAEILEVRLILEPRIAALAAQRATRFEIEKMYKSARRCEESDDYVLNERWDLVLHETIAQATGNSLLISLYEIINDLRDGEVWGRMKEPIMTPRRWKSLTGQHYELVQAIKDRDSVEAEKIMRKHLQLVRKHLLGS